MATVATNTFAGDLFSASDTVSGIPIGAAFPGRVVVIACLTNGFSGTVTINGVAADIVDPTNVIFAAAVVPTGTTATIVVPGSANTEVIGAWSLTGSPDTIAQDHVFNLDTGTGFPINVADNQCAVGWTVGYNDPPGTIGTFTATLTDDGAAFDTSAGVLGANKPARVGSANISSGGGTLTVTVGGFSAPFWYLALASYGGTGPPPPSDETLMGQIWMS
jgi:hypothetical protein